MTSATNGSIAPRARTDGNASAATASTAAAMPTYTLQRNAVRPVRYDHTSKRVSGPESASMASATSAAMIASRRSHAMARMLAEERGDQQIKQPAAQRRSREERGREQREE